MSDRYDFANLSPIEFEGLCVDLVEAETGHRFERFAEGADGGVDGRHGRAGGDIILQAKHYKNSTWSDLQKAVKVEARNIGRLKPSEYYLLTSQPLTPSRKALLASHLGHPSVDVSRIWGRTEINALLSKHASVEKRNIKLWLSSATVLDRLLKNDIAVFTEATYDEIERILKVFVVNPSLKKSAEILHDTHCLIVSGPPGSAKRLSHRFLPPSTATKAGSLFRSLQSTRHSAPISAILASSSCLTTSSERSGSIQLLSRVMTVRLAALSP
ncbi:restriction endonuclease [Rhizobium leguminosarum]|nr:restriction endonuclease [Rhizobium leguminosarum]